MTRHSKNATAHTVYTYHEKIKDSRVSGWGSMKMRLGKDSIREFDCCALSLNPAKTPVVTPEGVLYDKEAIIEYIIAQKQRISRDMRNYEKEKARRSEEVIQQSRDSELAKFLQANGQHVNPTISSGSTPSQLLSSKPGLCNGHYTNKPICSTGSSSSASPHLPSFWVPSETPDAGATAGRECMQPPDPVVRCPVSGAPLQLKHLYPVHFSQVAANEQVNEPARAASGLTLAQQVKYRCAVTGDVLTNYMQLCVLRPSGAVVTQECVDRIIRPAMLDPVTGNKLSTKDIIPLQRGATGFSQEGVVLTAKKEGVVMQV